ncbi:MAG: NUDIX hydrolase [Parcubacteria group bacterium GW2011_GWA1_47_10]|uniref:NUDIX hydrolase n=1 Tax=Candidatus Nomurabacteria bacterium GW2011_GWB1_47_6 TaxID=1618749 RepID=A0A0G1VZA4_9BACT|nr:MAG: NUDIX hydrolase [Parcubacteria group bacterium GW2011_GWA1_47_10]KKU75415.1 MAG: NUDIX hydrolase [Candidatus Nomurabacteria bacterium GW2011_GWB1_47_6]
MVIERPQSHQPIPLNAKRVFKGVIFDVYQWEQEMFDGSRAIFEKVKRADTVVVFAVLPDGKIILTKQEQPGRPPFIGATGGRIDEDEDVLTAAKRELLEESGYIAEEFILWDTRFPVGKVDWVVYTFIAKGLKKIADLNLDAGEKIELITLTLDELIDTALDKKTHFAEQEILEKFYQAKYVPEKKKELEELFKP